MQIERMPHPAAVFLTKRQIAERLGINVRTVERFIAAGELPAVMVGKRYRVREVDLIAYGEGRRIEAAGGAE